MRNTASELLRNRPLYIHLDPDTASRPLRSRIIAVKGRLLALTAPLDLHAGTIRWPETGRQVLLDFRGPTILSPVATTAAAVLERRVQPFPYLLLEVAHDVPLAAAHAPGTWGRILVITGGKGGTGKSVTAVNVALAASAAGLRTALVDGDFQTGSVTTLTGVRPPVPLGEVLQGRAPVDEALVSCGENLKVLASPVGADPHAAPSPWELARVVGLLDLLSHRCDLVVADTGAGIGPAITSFLALADDAWVVTLHEAPAIVDAYRLLRAAVREGARTTYHLIMNRVEDWAGAQAAGRSFAAQAVERLRVPVRLAGLVPEDRTLRGWAAGRARGVEPEATPAGRVLRALARSYLQAQGLSPRRPAPVGPRVRTLTVHERREGLHDEP